MTLTLKEAVELCMMALSLSAIYWKLNQRMKVIEMKQEETFRMLMSEIGERKGLRQMVEETHKEVKDALDHNTKAIIELKTVLDIIKTKFI